MLKITIGNQFKIATAAIFNFVSGHNLGVDQTFSTEFGTVMVNQQSKTI